MAPEYQPQLAPRVLQTDPSDADRDLGHYGVNPHDKDARITKMKDGRTHLAHKAEHAVDLQTGAVLAVTLQPADHGDTTTIVETLAEAGENVAELIGTEAPDQKPQ